MFPEQRCFISFLFNFDVLMECSAWLVTHNADNNTLVDFLGKETGKGKGIFRKDSKRKQHYEWQTTGT